MIIEDICFNKSGSNSEKWIQITDLLENPSFLQSPNPVFYRRVKARWDAAAKPLDSLGAFETMTAQMGAILGTDCLDLKKRAVISLCADNGVVAEGISQSGQEVTAAVARVMGQRCSSVGKMGAAVGADMIPVDIGINCDDQIPGLLPCRIAKGTRNFANEPAMTRKETLRAIQTGMDLVARCKEKGYTLLGTGEMGIGNTTTSAAVCAALLGRPASEIAGRGAGLSDAGLKKKIQVISDAIDRYELYGKDPITILSCVGGLDLAGLAGVMIGGSCYHIPIVLDGVITAVAALAAVRMFPVIRDYLIPSHISKEPAAKAVFKELALSPVIHGDLALGEGTGAVMLFALLDTAMTLYEKPLTFQAIDVEPYRRFL